MNFIFGVAGSAREVDWLLHDINAQGISRLITTHFVAEDGNSFVGSELNGCPVIADSHFFAEYSDKEVNCFVAIGSPAIRRKIAERLKANTRACFPSIVHPSVICDRRHDSVRIMDGAIIFPGSVITTDVEIGSFVFINTACTVGHDSRIGAFTTISPGVHISGNVTLDENVFIGTGAVILEKISVCARAVIGGGAVVVRSIDQPGTYVGTPAKLLVRKS